MRPSLKSGADLYAQISARNKEPDAESRRLLAEGHALAAQQRMAEIYHQRMFTDMARLCEEVVLFRQIIQVAEAQGLLKETP